MPWVVSFAYPFPRFVEHLVEHRRRLDAFPTLSVWRFVACTEDDQVIQLHRVRRLVSIPPTDLHHDPQMTRLIGERDVTGHIDV